MYRICKRFTFEASHQLQGLPRNHPCSRIHGHSYKVDLYLKSEILDKVGFIVDFGELEIIKNWLDDTLDHKHLNDVLKFNPTAENIAKQIYFTAKEFLPQMYKVRVWETEKCWAEYEESFSKDTKYMNPFAQTPVENPIV